MGERKKFDKAFKEQASRRIMDGDTTITKMADELGLHYTTVRDWVRQYKQDGSNAFPGSGNLKPEDDELRRLRRELADLKEENEILKKAAAYFAKNQK
jgi:transposase